LRATLLLADAAQSVDGKLYILGGGWSITGPGPAQMAIAIKLDVPWDQANRKHTMRLELLTEDGEPVTLRTGDAEDARIELSGDFEVGRPAGLRPGTDIDFSLALNLGPLPLEPGRRFVWRLFIDDTTSDDWRLVFTTRPATAQPVR
jgi:hypothetical protein